jgi:hypothetical protein
MAKIGNYKEICKKKDGNFTWKYNNTTDIMVMNAVMPSFPISICPITCTL